MRRNRKHQQGHALELYIATTPLADVLSRTIEDPEILGQLLHGLAKTVAKVYVTGRRHAICDAISATVGPSHPKEGLTYRLKVRPARPDEEEAATRLLADLSTRIPQGPAGQRDRS